jgi:hypothetical protein
MGGILGYGLRIQVAQTQQIPAISTDSNKKEGTFLAPSNLTLTKSFSPFLSSFLIVFHHFHCIIINSRSKTKHRLKKWGIK